jgi:hypothetical protein
MDTEARATHGTRHEDRMGYRFWQSNITFANDVGLTIELLAHLPNLYFKAQSNQRQVIAN